MNLELIRGDDAIIQIHMTEDEADVDITGWTFWLTIKKDIEVADAAAEIQKKVTSHTDPTHGITEFRLLNTDTDDLSGVYSYDVQYKDTSNPVIVKTLLIGNMSFRKDVTRNIA